MSTKIAPTATLRITRLIKAPRERVFAAWTTPEEIMKWFGPETCRVLSAKVDLRVGGAYHIRVRGPDCDTGQDLGEREVGGVYREVKRPTRLVYTWRWEGRPEIASDETLVTVDFLDQEGFTEVQITHDRFPTAEERDKHEHGWGRVLERLENHFNSTAESEPRCHEVGTFCWNELLAADPARATTFYTRLFGWKAEPMPGGMDYSLFKQEDEMVGGLMARPCPEAPPHWLAYVRVESVDASARRAAELGAKVLLPPKDIPTVGRIAVLQDPEGAPLGLFQPVQS